MNPLDIFKKWFEEELKLSTEKIPSACCFSTNGTDGYPNARFVSLKEVDENAFIITGPLTSRKAMEVNNSEKVALTFWWKETDRQVRIQGNATLISELLADKLFRDRSIDSQIVSIVSEQGKDLDNPEALNNKYQEVEISLAQFPLNRPENWGGYKITPVRIEFMEFKQTRFHDRRLFELKNGTWTTRQLQP